jgi:uncharacterized membrane protein YedE/YeeE
MFEFFTQALWSPYVAGAGIGVLSCLAFLLSDRPIGCSTAFVKAQGLIGKAIDPVSVTTKEYYREIIPQVDWAFMIIPGILIGAFISAFISGQFHVFWVPCVWGTTFGYNPLLRIAVAFAGGILLGFGARWAGGCTSGHGINGSIQLSLASIITACCFFVGGIATALVLFRVIGV